MRTPILLTSCILLTACASLGLVATTPDDLLHSDYRSSQQCFSAPLPEIQERVRSYMRRCHQPYIVSSSTSYSTPSGYTGHVQSEHKINWQVEERDSASGAKQFFARFNQGYTLGVAVQATPECDAAVQVFAANFGWKNRFERILAAANGESPECLSQ